MQFRCSLATGALVAIVILSIPAIGGYCLGRAQTVHIHDATDSIVYNPDDNTLSFNGVTLACQKPDQWRIK